MGGVSTVMETETKHPAARRRDARVTAILVVAGLWTLLHVYVGQRLLAQTPLAPGWRLLGWVGILLLVLAPFVALVAGRTEGLPAKRGLEVAGFTAMGLSSLLIVFALAGDALHARGWRGGPRRCAWWMSRSRVFPRISKAFGSRSFPTCTSARRSNGISSSGWWTRPTGPS